MFSSLWRANGLDKSIWVSAILVSISIGVPWSAKQWLEYPDRLAQITGSSTFIDNVEPYAREIDWLPSGKMAMLHKITPGRADFFDGQLNVFLDARAKADLFVLDAGCGGGLLTNELARRGYNITGLDMSLGALQFAQRTAMEEELHYAIFMHGSVYQLPFDAGSVDVILCSDVLEHLVDLPAVFREFHRVLRPGGLLLLDTINRTILSYLIAILGSEYVLGAIPKNSHDWRLFITPEELTKGLIQAGFNVSSNFPGFRPSAAMVLDALRAYVLQTISVTQIQGEVILEQSPGWVSYFAVATSL